MNPRSEIICQYLEGGREGAKCGTIDRLIKDIEEADIKICMSKRYEVCRFYKRSLGKTADCNVSDGILTA